MNNVLKIQKKVHFRDAELFASKAKVNIGNLFEWSNLEGGLWNEEINLKKHSF